MRTGVLPIYNNTPTSKKPRSIWRMWRQLTVFQRCATLVLVGLAVACFVVFPISSSSASSTPAPSEDHSGRVQHPPSHPSGDMAVQDAARNNNSIQNTIEQLREENKRLKEMLDQRRRIIKRRRGGEGEEHNSPAMEQPEERDPGFPNHGAAGEDHSKAVHDALAAGQERIQRQQEALAMLRAQHEHLQRQHEEMQRPQPSDANSHGNTHHVNVADNSNSHNANQVSLNLDHPLQQQQQQQVPSHPVIGDTILHNPIPANPPKDAAHSIQNQNQNQQQNQNHNQAAAHAAGAPAVSPEGLLPHVEESRDFGPKNSEQSAIVEAMRWAWKGYKEYAWGHDELLPISKTHSEWFRLGLTIVDSLDTLYIMDMTQEFAEARAWVQDHMQIDQDVEVNLFETTIRVLGGMLSTYHLSGDKIFLDRARDLGERLSAAFNPNSRVPFSDVNLHSRQPSRPKWGPDSTTSEVSTIQLEFKELARVTGEKRYADSVSQVMMHLRELPKQDGLVPIFINADSGHFSGSTITLGARGDSYYEYLLKQWLQTGKTETVYRDMYVEAMAGVKEHLVKHTQGPLRLTYIAELINGQSSPKMDHLVCFLPGTLALGAVNGLDKEDMQLAKDLLRTCHEMYAQMATGLAPEIVHFHTEGQGEMYVKPADAHNLLRPETAESLFILYRLTKDPIYRVWGWDMFQAFEQHTRIATGGYSSLSSVLSVPAPFRDKMESFFLAETLKYLFLLFADDNIIPLDKYVINTEAHPLPVFTP